MGLMYITKFKVFKSVELGIFSATVDSKNMLKFSVLQNLESSVRIYHIPKKMAASIIAKTAVTNPI
ncbi:hypothetical protein CIW83_11505 [Tissierella sp. P1]|nr:hypothetical protein CIW83_11505 [Tissierella sp. P1]